MVLASMVESAALELINLSYDSLESARFLAILSKISFNSSIIYSRVTSNYYRPFGAKYSHRILSIFIVIP